MKAIELLGEDSYWGEPENEDFTMIHSEESNFDGEKGFVDVEAIYKQKSTGKYFRVYFTDYGHGRSSFNSANIVEVQKKQKTIDYYE